MGQGYIQSNPPYRTSSLDFICTRLRLYKIPWFSCLLITRYRYYWRQIKNVSTNTDVKFGRQCIWRLSCNGISSWRHIIVAVRRRQTAIFFNFLGHKNEVYRKLKPLQEKVKYTFFSKLYYRVSRKKISSKNQPSYRHGGLEKGSLFDYKNGRYEKIRIFLAKGLVQAGAHEHAGQENVWFRKSYGGTPEPLNFVQISRFDL